MSTKTRIKNPNLNHLVGPIFHGVNRRFVLALENDGQRTTSKKHYLLNVGIKDYNVMIDGKDFPDQPVKDDKTTIATDQGDDYTTSSLLGYYYFKYYYKMIAI